MNDLSSSTEYNLAFDSLVEVRVSATNLIGQGTWSFTNTVGAKVRIVPSQMAPPTLGSDSTETKLIIDWV